MSSSRVSTPHGGLEALVAAATAANQANERSRRKRGGIDTPSANDTVQALATLLQDPLFTQALAGVQSSLNRQPYGSDNPYDPPNLASVNYQPGLTDTPFQQTRSGRISRPPLQPIPFPFLQHLSGQINGGGISANAGLYAQQYVDGFVPQNGVPNLDPQFWSQPQMTLSGPSTQPASLSPDPAAGAEMKDNAHDLPQWPLPPSGPGGRKKMPKDEMLARRRARNKESALMHRRKKQAKLEDIDSKLKEREAAYDILDSHCRALEKQVQELQHIILNAGLSLPTPFHANSSAPPAPISVNEMTAESNELAPINMGIMFNKDTPAGTIQTQAINHASVGSSAMDTTLNPFDMFSFLDMDGEDDAEFIPPTSPRDSEDGGGGNRTGKDKGKRRRHGEDEEDDDDFVDDDVEDEDLFLPIEDVPVPPAAQMESAMRSLGVDSQDDLARLINKMVTAGKEGMTSEMVDKLKVLISLVGPNGTWSTTDQLTPASQNAGQP
ncbi:hypothetical protein BD324DRAFT_638412 [Kockovaella imperatae]|uniref:BZIP domain-containing protein n=1 Tax=Kockovaella imperatae TaxID=4999 RepID=A0A1Y1U8B1_9TREE|nr:hypothetical protein BD324DRAFT_638412 [Kockovaella imperatae]ORX33737.1 hypothetical protein BD324DRAFT_638412 [Kockovaella imperatae]